MGGTVPPVLCRGRDSNPHAPEGTPGFKPDAYDQFRHPGPKEDSPGGRAHSAAATDMAGAAHNRPAGSPRRGGGLAGGTGRSPRDC